MKSFIKISILLLVTSPCFAQDKKYQALLNDVEWGEGSIILTDGSELKGLVSYNDENGSISFENGSQSKSLLARNILGFEYYDKRVEKLRQFYSLECPDDYTQTSGPFIFEVLKVFKTFAVLYKVAPVEINEKNTLYNPFASNPYDPRVQRKFVKVTQRESIHLFPADGVVTTYLEMSFHQTEGKVIDQKRTKNKIVNKDILIQCTGALYPELVAYAKKNRLEFDEKEDLHKIFNHYEALVSEN